MISTIRQKALKLLMAVWAWICAQGRRLRDSPLAFYRSLG